MINIKHEIILLIKPNTLHIKMEYTSPNVQSSIDF